LRPISRSEVDLELVDRGAEPAQLGRGAGECVVLGRDEEVEAVLGELLGELAAAAARGARHDGIGAGGILGHGAARFLPGAQNEAAWFDSERAVAPGSRRPSAGCDPAIGGSRRDPAGNPRRMASDDDGPHGEIDWATAAVRDGRLTVEITGEPGEAWSDRVEEIVERLDRPGSAWGETSVKKATVRVKDVGEGAETDLRHLLESAVLQANAEFAPDDEDGDDDDAGSDEDRAMTAAFRAFAASGEEAADGATERAEDDAGA
jgi:hypothetical protein